MSATTLEFLLCGFSRGPNYKQFKCGHFIFALARPNLCWRWHGRFCWVFVLSVSGSGAEGISMLCCWLRSTVVYHSSSMKPETLLSVVFFRRKKKKRNPLFPPSLFSTHAPFLIRFYHLWFRLSYCFSCVFSILPTGKLF